MVARWQAWTGPLLSRLTPPPAPRAARPGRALRGRAAPPQGDGARGGRAGPGRPARRRPGRAALPRHRRGRVPRRAPLRLAARDRARPAPALAARRLLDDRARRLAVLRRAGGVVALALLGPRAGARLPALADGLSPPLRPARAHGRHPLLRSPALPLPRLWRHRRALRQGLDHLARHEATTDEALARSQLAGLKLLALACDLPRSPRADGRAGLRAAARGSGASTGSGLPRVEALLPAGARAPWAHGVERALRRARLGRAQAGRAGPRDRGGAPALRLQRLPQHLQAAAGAVAGRVLEPLLLLLQGDAGGLLLLPDVRALLPGPPGPAHARRDPRGRRASATSTTTSCSTTPSC